MFLSNLMLYEKVMVIGRGYKRSGKICEFGV